MTRSILCNTTILFFLVVVTMNLPKTLGDGILFLPLLWIVFLTVFSEKPLGLTCALLTGFFLDTFSPLPFGVHVISLSVVAVLLEIAAKHVLTNRSLYATLVLGLLATIAYRLLLWSVAFIFSTMGDVSLYRPIALFQPWQVVVHAAVLVIGFYLSVAFRRLFRRYFLA